jgi:hypothetical protein
MALLGPYGIVLTRRTANFFHHNAVGLVAHSQTAILLVGGNAKETVSQALISDLET